jgi:hypothetical protein
MSENQGYWLSLTASLLVACLGLLSPSGRMPLDYDAIVSRSIPFAAVWALVLVVSVWRFKSADSGS